jgi:hypothetical protein
VLRKSSISSGSSSGSRIKLKNQAQAQVQKSGVKTCGSAPNPILKAAYSQQVKSVFDGQKSTNYSWRFDNLYRAAKKFRSFCFILSNSMPTFFPAL